MTNLLMIYSAWILFAILCGFVEAYYYSAVYHKVTKRIKHDHAIFTVIRGIFAVGMLYLINGVSWYSVFLGVPLMAMFPFFHDGIYYLMRNKLDDVYPLGFRDHSKTSDAIFNFNYSQRWWLLWFNFLLTLIYIWI